MKAPIASRLREWMDAHQVTARRAAKLSGYSADLIWRTLRGGPLGDLALRDMEDLLTTTPPPPPPPPKKLAGPLREWMADRGMGPTTVADLVGCHRETVRRILKGSNPYPSTRQSFERLIEVSR